MFVGQLCVVQPHLVQHRGQQVKDTDRIHLGAVSKRIGGTMHIAGFQSAARGQRREGVHIVIPTSPTLRGRQPAKFSHP